MGAPVLQGAEQVILEKPMGAQEIGEGNAGAPTGQLEDEGQGGEMWLRQAHARRFQGEPLQGGGFPGAERSDEHEARVAIGGIADRGQAVPRICWLAVTASVGGGAESVAGGVASITALS